MNKYENRVMHVLFNMNVTTVYHGVNKVCVLFLCSYLSCLKRECARRYSWLFSFVVL